MNALTEFQLPHPTLEEPIPRCAGTPGMNLLLSATAVRLADTATASERCDLIEVCRWIRRSMEPATVQEIALEIEALALHFPVLRYTEAEHRIVNLDWIEDLKGWPVDLIREARRQWRNSAKEKFPTPGQLKATVQAIFDFRKQIANRAEDFIRLSREDAG